MLTMLYFQLVIMAGTVLLAYYFECTDTFEVHVQGFFCQDADLLKPYPGPEEDSFIPPIVLYCVLAAAPTIIVSKTNYTARCSIIPVKTLPTSQFLSRLKYLLLQNHTIHSSLLTPLSHSSLTLLSLFIRLLYILEIISVQNTVHNLDVSTC